MIKGASLWRKADTAHSYGCVMLLPDQVFQLKVEALGKMLVKDDDLYIDSEDPSYGRPQAIHTTVLFGIRQTNVVKRIQTVLRKFSPREFTVTGISSFGTAPDYDVLKLDLDGSDLYQLHDLLAQEFPDYYETHEFHPHMTLAYVKKGVADRVLGQVCLKEPLMANVQAVDYSHQDGSHEYLTPEGEKL
jgi:hypothetical protein